jgi:hypothetical protein
MDSVVPKEGQPPPVRLFVGGLPPGVAASQLQQRFQPFGVPIVHILPLKEGSADGESKRSFCYVDLQPKDASSVLKCLTAVSLAAVGLMPICMHRSVNPCHVSSCCCSITTADGWGTSFVLRWPNLTT